MGDVARRPISSIAQVTGLQTALVDADRRAVVGSRNTEASRALVSFIDDDGADAVLSVLKPLFVAKGVPCALSIPGNSSLVTDPAKRAEVKALQDDNGWEVLSHTMAHTNLTTMTDAEIEADCQTFLETFTGYGLHVNSISYPWGAINAAQYPIISKYFVAGFDTGTLDNTATATKDYAIHRRALGTSMTAGLDTLAEFQALIDAAVVGDYWLVFMMHSGVEGFDSTLVGQVIDYVLASEVEIVGPSDALRVFGSVVQSGAHTASYFDIKPGGHISTNRYSMTSIVTRAEADAPLATSQPEQNIAVAASWTLGGGVVVEGTYANGYQYQIFNCTDGIAHRRRWNGTAWGAWRRYLVARADVSYTNAARTLAAGATLDVVVYNAALISTDAHVAHPTGTLEAGIMWTCWSHGNGAAIIRMYNSTAAEVTTAQRVWTIQSFA